MRKLMTIGARHRVTLFGIGAIVVLLLLVTVLASEVVEDETLAVDRAILLAMRDGQGTPLGPVWFEQAMVDLSALGSTAVAATVVIVACLALLLARQRVQALLVALCGAGTAMAVLILKAIIARDRPTEIDHLVSLDGYSFPSGHTLTASAIYPLLAILLARVVPQPALKRFAVVIAAVFAFIVGFSRVYLGVHYPTDVLAGWGLGISWAIACSIVVSAIRASGNHSSMIE